MLFQGTIIHISSSYYLFLSLFCFRRESDEIQKIAPVHASRQCKNSLIWLWRKRETAVFCTFSALINAFSRHEIVNIDKSKESDASEILALSKHRSNHFLLRRGKIDAQRYTERPIKLLYFENKWFQGIAMCSMNI